MSNHSTLTNTPAEVTKESFGTPLQSFGVKTQGFSAIRKELLGTIVAMGIVGYGIFTTIQSINYLGFDYYLKERTSGLFRAVVVIFAIIYRVDHLIKLFSTHAEVFAKGFYLKHRNKEYAYAFTDIVHLQKTLVKGTNNQINSVGLTLSLTAGETVKIFES
ncbi:MAG: hypothetical protein LBO09_00965 [Candidatus Peribacteria bacterium]|jgi:hypothetical protein|nr:hypothetical protein [Candidatus Peribacteria bacterium]